MTVNSIVKGAVPAAAGVMLAGGIMYFGKDIDIVAKVRKGFSGLL